MEERDVRPGRRVAVPWGLEYVEGTVVRLVGPPGNRFARVRVELGGPDDVDAMEEIGLSLDLLEDVDQAV